MIAGGLLPLFLTPKTEPKISFSPVNSIAYENEHQKMFLTSREKLALLLYGGQYVYVGEDMMTSTSQQIQDVLLDRLDTYFAQGFLPNITQFVEISLRPCMIFETENGDKFNLFWQASVTYENELDQLTIFCTMDDETQKLYSFYCGTWNTPIFQEDPEHGLYRFADNFFDLLGISDAELYANSVFRDSLDYLVPVTENDKILVEFYYLEGNLSTYVFSPMDRQVMQTAE